MIIFILGYEKETKILNRRLAKFDGFRNWKNLLSLCIGRSQI